MESLEKEFRAYVKLLSVINEIEQEAMVDPVSIAKSAGTIFQAINQIQKYAQEIDDKQKSGELMRLVGELTAEVGHLNLEIAKKDQEIADKTKECNNLKKEFLKLKNSIHKGDIELFCDGVMYWNIKDIWGDDYSQPFCTACFEVNNLQIALNPAPRSRQTIGENFFTCPICKTQYNVNLAKTSELRKRLS